MDRDTVAVYEAQVGTYLRRGLRVDDAVDDFARDVPEGALRLDLGCGPGHMTGALGVPVVAADAAWAMVSRVEATRLRVRSDLEAQPFRTGAFGGVWASKCLQHVPDHRVPLALADLHRTMSPGARLDVIVFEGTGAGGGGEWCSTDDLPGRRFWDWPRQRLLDVVAGAGFTDIRLATVDRPPVVQLHVTAVRARSLADTVGAGMRLLVCGLNPSLYAADAGVGFARPGNRFWKAAIAAGVASVPNDARGALLDHGTGMTDLVKRATTASSELTVGEYRAGLDRVRRLVDWLHPPVVAFVGLEGWRAAVDRHAVAGWQPDGLAGARAYVLPSTSGLNAHSSLADLTGHLREAAAGCGGGRGSS